MNPPPMPEEDPEETVHEPSAKERIVGIDVRSLIGQVRNFEFMDYVVAVGAGLFALNEIRRARRQKEKQDSGGKK